MYFNYDEVINIDNLISSDYKFYAHLKKYENKKETLKEHTVLCQSYFKKIFESKDFEKVFFNFEKYYFGEISNEATKLFREILLNTIGFHDLGKINPLFQIHNMDNPLKNDILSFNQLGTQHSIISAVLYIDYYLKELLKLENKEERNNIRDILFVNSYIISRHHSGLGEFEEFLNSFVEKDALKVIEIFKENYKEIYVNDFKLSNNSVKKHCKSIVMRIDKFTVEKSIYLYTYCRFLYSVLVACDYYATTEFMNDTKLESFGDISDIKEIYQVYKDTKVYKSIRKYEKENYHDLEKHLEDETDINILRNEMFLDAENEILKDKNKNILFLEAPTGSGKTNVSMNLSFKLIEQNKNLKKIIDVYPFNTLIEQNIENLNKTFGHRQDIFNKIAVINSVIPIKTDEDENEFKDYAKSLLNRQFLNYPIILTTHVSLFDTMFGEARESIFGFHQMANSVIVLDEIQSYKNIIWSEIIEFLDIFSKMLNLKVIIMSATLPDLRMLLREEDHQGENCANLILDRNKYFSNNLFRKRVEISYELIDSENIQEDLYNHILKNIGQDKKILVEFITKKSAYDFYNQLRNFIYNKTNSKVVVELMTGDDNIIERNRILERIKSQEVKKNGMVLIATQVIEAGIDIDMDIGYKDISKLDSEEQFLGRINRSCKRHGKVYFFNHDKVDKVYKQDYRGDREFTLLNDKMQKIIINKNFGDYYIFILNLIRNHFNETLNDNNLELFFKNSVGKLNFNNVKERMKLIDENQWNMSVYLARVIEKREDNKLIHIDGREVWHRYKNLLKDNSINYSEKQVKLSEVRSLMNYFIYDIKKNSSLAYNDKIGELYYIENGEKYFDEEKLNKEKFSSEIGLFLDL